MFYVLSKAIWSVAVPSTLVAVIITAGALLLLRRRSRIGRRLLATGVALLLAIGFAPVGSWLLLPLEDRFPQFRDDGRPVDGVIVLGGSVYPDITAARGQLNFGEGGERMVAMADLARRYPSAAIAFVGGEGPAVNDEVSEAAAVRRYAGVLGVDPTRFLYENRSRTTWENAVNAKAMLPVKAGQRWLLVTSARHMPRAIGCFRQAGIDVTAYPVDYLTTGWNDAFETTSGVRYGLERVDDAAKEWIGLLFYRLSGRTDALFPSPAGSAIAIR